MATFQGEAWFGSATFQGNARFESAVFERWVSLGRWCALGGWDCPGEPATVRPGHGRTPVHHAIRAGQWWCVLPGEASNVSKHSGLRDATS
ncbi:pentapeptide repeat-containing protein [Streptomyces sp. NPDC051207]|uniref:pentapeptide repeat-containing protein n=1 Tax=Streptomyces sp. NPDC051207 TaxID=3154641 RepID=UPI00343377F4